jgi:hypothetical protein
MPSTPGAWPDHRAILMKQSAGVRPELGQMTGKIAFAAAALSEIS